MSWNDNIIYRQGGRGRDPLSSFQPNLHRTRSEGLGRHDPRLSVPSAAMKLPPIFSHFDAMGI
jgi:hypothetical protein